MSTLKEKAAALLYKIRNPQTDENEREVRRDINFKRLLFLIPFIIAAVVILILSFD